MRWRFIDPNNAAEVKRKNETLRRIERWWSDFAAKAPEIIALFTRKTKWDLIEWMGGTLQAIDKRLMWEYGPAVRDEGHRLVITPESDRHLRPLVETILQKAPALPGWEFYPYRLPEDLDMTARTVEARTGGSLDGVVVQVSAGDFGRFDLKFLGPNTEGTEDEQASSDAFVATETLLGESLLERHIGVIEAAPLKTRGGPRPIPLDRLYETVQAAIQSRRDQLPERPHLDWAYGDDVEWTTLELEPEEQDDYPGRVDLFVAVTPVVELWKASLADELFVSERFSRCGETFGVLKIDGADGLDECEFGDRGEIEDAVQEALAPGRLGGALGGGTGRRYSYVELALLDVDGAIAKLQERMQKARLPMRSWILFHDADWRGEWVGIHPDSPPPPGFDD